MIRKIKPLKWKKLKYGGQALFVGKIRFGQIYEWGSGYIGYFKDLLITKQTRPEPEAKAAVEQAFLKWLDTFSEEVKE